MEASSFFPGGYYSAGADEFSQEKREQKPGDHFMVEDLLDFPNDDDIMTDGFFDTVTGNSTDSSTVTVVDSCNSSFSGNEPHFSGDVGCRNFTDAQFSGELCVPVISQAEVEYSNLFAVTLLFSTFHIWIQKNNKIIKKIFIFIIYSRFLVKYYLILAEFLRWLKCFCFQKMLLRIRIFQKVSNCFSKSLLSEFENSFSVITVRWIGWAWMALELRGRIILKRRPAQNPSVIRNQSSAPHYRISWTAIPTRNSPKRTDITTSNERPRQSQKQAATLRPLWLVHAPPRAFPRHLFIRVWRLQETAQNDVVEEEREFRLLRWRPEVPALRGREDPAVANRAYGSQNAVQCMWCPIQIGSVGTRIPTRLEPDVCVRKTLELPSEGAWTQTSKGSSEVSSPSISWSNLHFQRN